MMDMIKRQFETPRMVGNAEFLKLNRLIKKHYRSLYIGPKHIRQAQRQTRQYLTKSLATNDAPVSFSRISRLETRVAKLKDENARLRDELSQISTEKTKPEQSKTDAPHKSSLSLYCEEHNIHTFPDNPVEALRGLFAEFNIKESSTDIIRDVREHR